jgi:hypothetical protein
MRIPIPTDLSSRDGTTVKDARQLNAFIDGENVVKRPCAQGGIVTGFGLAQGGIGFTINDEDFVVIVNDDVVVTYPGPVDPTNWENGKTYPAGGSGPGATFATWNPLDKSANILLSNGNLSTSDPYDIGGSVRATVGKSSGKWYWEITAFGYSITAVGVGNSSASVMGTVGIDANGWAYFPTSGPVLGPKVTNNIVSAYAGFLISSYPFVIGVALDMDAGTVSFIYNNVDLGVAFSGLTGTLYPMATEASASAIPLTLANFGASAFSYTVPSGYNSGLYV